MYIFFKISNKFNLINRKRLNLCNIINKSFPFYIYTIYSIELYRILSTENSK